MHLSTPSSKKAFQTEHQLWVGSIITRIMEVTTTCIRSSHINLSSCDGANKLRRYIYNYTYTKGAWIGARSLQEDNKEWCIHLVCLGVHLSTPRIYTSLMPWRLLIDHQHISGWPSLHRHIEYLWVIERCEVASHSQDWNWWPHLQLHSTRQLLYMHVSFVTCWSYNKRQCLPMMIGS